MKLLKRGLPGLILFLGLISFGVYLFLKTTLAPLDGQIQIQNLSHPVTITRDTFGIPHIQADNKTDALRALGFVMASERLFQMELSRRMTQGNLSEVFGEAALKSDKLYRSLMLKRSMERMLELEKREGRFDNKLWAEMEAYFDGVNQYIETRPLPYELQILRIKPRPFTPLDAFIMTGHMAYSFGIALKADPLMTELAKKFPREQFQTLRNDPLTAPLKTAENHFFKPFELFTEGLFSASFDGSNAWLVAPQRSQSGKSLFANDPHIGFSSPSVWVEAHIQTPDFELYGHYLPLVPFAILGHNRHHAWGFTMSLADDMDLYRETLDREQKTALFQNKPLPYQEWTETIKIKGQPDLNLAMIETSHGPLMDEVLSDKGLSLKWAYHRPLNNPMKSLREMAEAHTLKDFENALQHATAPGLNVMYADAENIAWWIFGDIAVKKNPNSDMILDGASGVDEYQKVLPWEEKPHLVNPPQGFIVTANSRPAGLSWGIRGDWQADDRHQTITKALSEKDLWSAEDFKVLQTENYNSQNKLLLEKLLENLELGASDSQTYSKQLESLKAWNLRSDSSSLEAALFHQWNNENILLLLSDWEDEKRQAYLNTPYAWSFYKKVLLDPQSQWEKGKDLSQLLTQGFLSAAKKTKDNPTWGSLHTVEYTHPLGRSFPLNLIFNLGPYPMPGAYNEINNNKMRALGGDFKVIAGPSTRRIIDFANPQKSWGINPIGISGHLLSPFYKDQVPMFLEGKYRPQLMDEKDIAATKTHELKLIPPAM
ncbi:penicillin acylase family protein [Bdellovibrio sp.]|uniref:penicillin acylase family protein n=1 Tax=Bdellovibrio sp. TaxID=28201 RepID=UPI0039E5945A